MTKSKIVETRYCKKCGGESAVLWYTKRGRMEVMCLKCGTSWGCFAEDFPVKNGGYDDTEV